MRTHVSRVFVGRRWALALFVSTFFGGAAPAAALPLSTAYIDTVSGLEWAELSQTTLLSWDEVASVCATDGVNACSGNLGELELLGWRWATSAQVLNLFVNASELTADLLTEQHIVESNSRWAAQLLSLFAPTLILGRTAAVLGLAADGPSFDPRGAWTPYVQDGETEDVASRRRVIAKYQASASTGVWLYRPVSVPEPTTLSLMILGGAGLLVRHVRNRRQQR